MQFLKRAVYFELKQHLNKPEISLILGPRQAGKTTIMLKLGEDLKREKRPFIYLNLDVIEDRQYFQTQHTLLDRVEKTLGKKPAVVFIDEIHRLENAGLFLKGLYDLKTPYKFVVSGSGSLELKANIIEPMTGRKRIFNCLPLSFGEFSAHKLKVELNQTEKYLAINPLESQRLMVEYLSYGGYPRVVLASIHQEKIEILSEIYQSYLEKDIQLLLGVEKEEAFNSLVRILGSQIGNIVNRAELSSILGLSERTVEKYLFLLEKTFIIALTRPFFRNARKEIRKSPKVYFLDMGFLRLAQGVISLTPKIEGGLFENACFLRLNELDLREKPHFWRSISGAEVDFVVSSPQTGESVPIEIKSSFGKKRTLGKSLVSFLDKYKPKKIFIYTKEEESSFKKLGANVSIIPFHCLPKFA